MSVSYLAETAVELIKDYIKENIADELAKLRVDRGDARVTTEPPRKYFIYEEAKGYKTPAVFIIARSIDFQKEVYQGNHTTANLDVGVSVLIEARLKEELTIKAFRYQAALHSLLNQHILVETPDKAKLFLRVVSAEFSPVFTAKGHSGRTGTFRKEVALSVEVQQRESF